MKNIPVEQSVGCHAYRNMMMLLASLLTRMRIFVNLHDLSQKPPRQPTAG